MDNRFVGLYPNAVNVAVVAAFNAICALFPLKWQADVRE